MYRSLIIFGGVLLYTFAAFASAGYGQAELTADQLDFFEKHIRPVLVTECYSCHAHDAKEIQGGLTLDTREGLLKGGDTGPAVVPGDARKSLLIKAIKQVSDDLQMPPEKKLAADVIANFERWIAMGAPDPRDGSAKSTKYEIDIEKGRQFWSFQPPVKSAPPEVKNVGWPKTEIDRFVLAKLEANDLEPVADADARALVRRIYFDLIGLPPTPEAVDEFVAQHAADSKAAVESVVDQLLESAQFGERWGRHWLDVARYAESSGRAANFAYPHAWRYRDWVIAAVNADMPYDQFIRAQIAGDLLPSNDDTQKAEQLIATGFLAIGPKSHNEQNRRQFQMDLADEQIDATFQAFQALTVACARCHDHKFDPIPQTDYYALAGIFQSTETCYGTIRVIQSNHPSRLIELPAEATVTMPLEPLTASRRESIEQQIQDQRDRMSELTGGSNTFIQRIFMASRIEQLRSQLRLYDSEGTPRPLAMGVSEGRFVFDSPVYVRGELDQPGNRVRRGFPQVLTSKQPNIRWGSGRRELADWIASSDNPLTARVMANRIWLHLIGRGFVSTPDNFGASGQPPSHPELLDYLAVSFVESDWSVKQLIRTIILSRTYQLSSEFDQENYDADPDNVLVWRIPKRRLEAEALRDTMLQVGGRLDLTPSEGSIVARGGEGNVGFRLRGDPSAFDSHRSVYLPIVRDLVPETLTLFDFPDPSLIIGERATTTIPAQSLFLMNNQFVIRQAEGFAGNLLTYTAKNDAGSDGADDQNEDALNDDIERIKRAYEIAYSREASDTEVNAALKFLDDYGQNHSRRATWAALCQALMASAEFAQR